MYEIEIKCFTVSVSSFNDYTSYVGKWLSKLYFVKILEKKCREQFLQKFRENIGGENFRKFTDKFYLLQATNESARPIVDIGFSGYFVHGAQQTTPQLKKLFSQFPPWTVTSGWTATYKSYTFWIEWFFWLLSPFLFPWTPPAYAWPLSPQNSNFLFGKRIGCTVIYVIS